MTFSELFQVVYIYIYIYRARVRSFEIHLRLERFFNRKLRFISLGANINFIFYRYFYPPFLPFFLPSFLPPSSSFFFLLLFHSSFYRLIENEMELSLQVWIGTEGNDFYFAASKWNRLFSPSLSSTHFVSSSRQFLIKRVVAVKLGTIYSFYRCKYARGSQAKLTVAACSPPPSRITSSRSNRTKCGSRLYIFFSLRIGKCTILLFFNT